MKTTENKKINTSLHKNREKKRFDIYLESP